MLNFLHNLKYFNCINNMELFNPRAFFRSTCNVINQNQAQFVEAEVGLQNSGATCYMNATLQAFLHDPALRGSFRYGEAKTEYDNRLLNLWNYYIRSNVDLGLLLTTNFSTDYNNLQTWVIKQRFPFLYSRLKPDNNGNADWSKAPDWVIQEIKLILKCFADANADQKSNSFYKCLINYFGENCQKLPPDAIDMSYEFFLLSNKVDSIVEQVERGQNVNKFFTPKRFKDFMSVKNPLFKGIAANDAKDLVNFLIMTWHEEQNKAKLQQNKNPAEIAGYINSLAQQINVYINNLKYNYTMCMAISNNNKQFENYCLLNVYSCKRNIQYQINNIIKYAQMINDLDTDKKHQLNTNNIIQAAQNLFSAIGGYNSIDDFKCDFPYMYQCIGNIFNHANAVSNNQDNQMEIPDQRDENKVFKAFVKDFTEKNQSAISDQLYITTRNVTTCSSCNVKTYNYQTNYFIVFPLEEVRKYKKIQGTTVTLHDCFEYEEKDNLMDGQNSMYCNRCKKQSSATMQTSLITAPKNLVLLFNRGKGKEFDVNINYPEFFDQYDIGKNFALSDQKYTIKYAYSNIKHLGESGMAGHFIMDGQSERDGSLNQYNDGGVQKVSNISNSGMPYLVFYRDIEPNEIVNQILRKVSSDKNQSNYPELIAKKFSELGELDIKKENSNESRRLRFSYLLMQAVLPDLIEDVREYKSLTDNKISGFICAIFDLIKNETDFNDNTMESYRAAIQSKKGAIRASNAELDVDIVSTTKNMKSIFESKMGIQNNSHIGMYNKNNQLNANAITQKYASAGKKSPILTWLKFIFAVVFAVGVIIALVFHSYIIATILAAVDLFILFAPKFCRSGCGNLCTSCKKYDVYHIQNGLNRDVPQPNIKKDYDYFKTKW